MRRIRPEVYLVAETKTNALALENYLSSVGADEWETDAESDGEELVEVMGRACYRSFEAGLNANVTKVREGNQKYLGNIISVGHGSVMEHASVSFIFANVSRVFTHELVRHRVGVGISQESLRYVRLTDLGLWLPDQTLNEIAEHCGHEAVAEFVRDIEEDYRHMEQRQLKWAKLFKLDDGNDFSYKKKATSMMRRGAPIGLGTAIGWTANHRTLRHVLETRTSRHAEEEIRLVFEQVGVLCKKNWPNLYGDFNTNMVDGFREFIPEKSKI